MAPWVERVGLVRRQRSMPARSGLYPIQKLGSDVPPPHQVQGVTVEHPDTQNLGCNLTARPVLQLHNLFFALVIVVG